MAEGRFTIVGLPPYDVTYHQRGRDEMGHSERKVDARDGAPGKDKPWQ